jgi:hypothetical protein
MGTRMRSQVFDSPPLPGLLGALAGLHPRRLATAPSPAEKPTLRAIRDT